MLLLVRLNSLIGWRGSFRSAQGTGVSLCGMKSIWKRNRASCVVYFFFFQAEDGIRDLTVTGVQTCALPISQAGDSGLSAEALSVVGLVQANPELTQALTELMTKQAELRALRYKYSDAYPRVQRLLGEIATLQRQTIPTLARQLDGQLAAKETELGRRVAADSRTLKQIPARAIQEARLRRDAALAENLYLSLQGKYDEARLAEASTLSDVRVLDSAVVPRRPVKNTRRRDSAGLLRQLRD